MTVKLFGPKRMPYLVLKGLSVSLVILLLIACTTGHRPRATESAIPIGDVAMSAEQLAQFEPEIAALEAKALEGNEPRDGIVFAGSSSIRKWDSLTSDMAPLPVVNRGFGGAIIKQVTHNATRMIVPLRPKLIVFYCGENDIANDKYPAEMPLNDFKTFANAMRQKLPGTGILFISMKPSPLRWKYWAKFQQSNRLIQSYIETQKRMWYVDVGKAMLNRQGFARPELFLSDSLHMNQEGYALWTRILKPEVARHFDELSPK